MKVPYRWRRWRDASDEKKVQTVCYHARRVALVVGVLRLADTTIPDRMSLLLAQSIGSTRVCAVVLEMKMLSVERNRRS